MPSKREADIQNTRICRSEDKLDEVLKICIANQQEIKSIREEIGEVKDLWGNCRTNCSGYRKEEGDRIATIEKDLSQGKLKTAYVAGGVAVGIFALQFVINYVIAQL